MHRQADPFAGAWAAGLVPQKIAYSLGVLRFSISMFNTLRSGRSAGGKQTVPPISGSSHIMRGRITETRLVWRRQLLSEGRRQALPLSSSRHRRRTRSIRVRELQETLSASTIALEISSRNSRVAALQKRWDHLRAGLDLVLQQRGADMANVPGGASGLLYPQVACTVPKSVGLLIINTLD